MSDDRLFASNHAICRKWYFINIVILTIIAFVTRWLFTDIIIPQVISEVYLLIAQWILYFTYLIYLITFFALIDRRLYDIFGDRLSNGYKNMSAFFKLAVFVQIFALYCEWKTPTIPVSYEFINFLAMIFDFIFLLMVFSIGMIRGKISSLTYEEYQNKVKYE
jgi:hypothetical protein